MYLAKQSKFFASAFCLTMLAFQTASQAATFTLVELSGICNSTDSGGTISSANCEYSGFGASAQLNGAAKAGRGSIGIRSRLDGSVGLPGGTIIARSKVIARFIDSIEVFNAPTAGFLQFQYRIEGSQEGEREGSQSTTSTTSTTTAVLNGTSIYNEARGAGGSASESSTSFATSAYVDGRHFFDMRMYAELECKAGAFAGEGGARCSSEVDFYNTLYILGALVFDSDMNLVEGATLTSESGFDYLNGVSEVPVPAALPLFVSALGIFGFLGRRRSQGV